MQLAELLYSNAEYPLRKILRDIGIADTIMFNNSRSTDDINATLTTFDKLAMISDVNNMINKNMNKKHTTALAIINHSYDCNNIVSAYAHQYILVFNDIIPKFTNMTDIKSALQNGLRIKDLACGYNINDINDIIAQYSVFTDTIKKLYIDPQCHHVSDKDLVNCTSVESLELPPDCPYITTFAPFAKSLKSLYLPLCHGVDNIMLRSCTSITELNVCGCRYITSCDSFANTLRILNASNAGNVICNFLCGITNTGLSKCTQLEVLYASNNDKISTCRQFAQTLRILHADGRLCGISTDSLKLCTQIEELNANLNNRIVTCAPFARSLRILYAACSECGINDDGLALCTKITKLYAHDNPKITTCISFRKTLCILDASKSCGIDNNGIKLCTQIEELNARNNHKITTCAPFAKSLLKLYAYNNCGISNVGLALCIHIKELYADDNCKITSCAPFAKTLRVLSASGTCGIDDYNLKLCTGITEVHSSMNNKISVRKTRKSRKHG